MKHHKILIAILATATLISCNQSNDIAERNKQTIMKAHEELLDKSNLAYADEVFAAEYSFPGLELKGPDLIRSYVTDLKRAFPDLQYKIDRVVAEGNVVAWTRTCTGTHSADFMGYKATGKKVTWQETDFSQFNDDGKIVQEWGVTDFDVNAGMATSIEGVYEYFGDTKGQSTLRNGKFVFLYGPSKGGQVVAKAGTFKLDGEKVVCTYAYSTDPKDVGTLMTWGPKSWSGDTLTYNFYNASGEVSGEARAVRVSR